MSKPGRRNWSPAEAARLEELAGVGITKVEAARRLSRSPTATYRHAKRAGLNWTPPTKPQKPPRGPAPRQWTAAEDELLRELSVQGIPINLAAIQLDRDYFTTWRRVRRLGLTWPRDTQARARLREYVARSPTMQR